MKLKDNSFDLEEIKIMESMHNGIYYSNLLIKHYLKFLKFNGALRFNEYIPYDENMIAAITSMNIDILRSGLFALASLKLIERFDEGTMYIRRSRKNSIMLCGQPGSGNTHLTVALALNFMNKNIKVVYMPYRGVITKIKQNMLDDAYYKKIISKYQTCDVLLMDDLFKGKINETGINIVFEILNYRYLNFLPVITSTEFTMAKWLAFDEAIGSRIYEMCKDYIVEIGKEKENNYRLR